MASAGLAWAVIAAMVVLVPWLGGRAYRRLERGEIGRVALYQLTLVFEALYAGAAVAEALVSGQPDQVLPVLHRVAPVLPAGIQAVVPAVVVGAFIGLALPVLIPSARRKLAAATEELALLPRSARERRWFAAVAVAAGVGEELLYRGFLWYALSMELPGLALGWRWAIAAAIFGLGHTYQKAKGVVVTGLMGAGFMGLYLATGTLLPVIILHALVDLRVLLLAPAGRQPPAA